MFFSLFMITASVLIGAITVFILYAVDQDRRLNRSLAHRAEQVMPLRARPAVRGRPSDAVPGGHDVAA